jgi:hypothetical protein
LTVFEILTQPAPEPSNAKREEVKGVAHLLLEKLKRILTFNWRQFPRTILTTTRHRVLTHAPRILD